MENEYKSTITYMQGITIIEIYNVEENTVKCCYKHYSTNHTTIRFIDTTAQEEAEIMKYILINFYF